MKSKITMILLLIPLVMFSQSLTLKWEIKDAFKNPETALYSQKGRSIFVSCINGNMYEKDGNGFISKLSLDGKIEKLNWVEGLNGPKGMDIYEGVIYVTDIDELVLISMNDAKIIKKYKVEGSVFLNDVSITKDGKVFISDSKANKIFCLANGQIKVWLESDKLEKINGMLAERNDLLVCSRRIMAIDYQASKIDTILEATGGIDGLERISGDQFLYSNWDGRIYLTKGKQLIKLLDTTNEIQQAGDLDFVRSKKLVVVPTLRGNSVVCYKLKYH